MTADPAGPPAESEIARAKVNLFLHVLGRREDGYHELESLAVFPKTGDRLSAAPAGDLTLEIDGPFGAGLESGPENLVLRAAAALRALTPGRPGAALRLEKNLPVASGVGGGSADAGAALRLLLRLWPGAPAAAAPGVAAALGADAPVCFAERPAIMRGIGERLSKPPAFPAFWTVLTNPGAPLSTAVVFGALERRERPAAATAPRAFATLGDLADWLAAQRNDLEAPARRALPEIGETLEALAATKGCRLARMSGSGATCFGLYETARDAAEAAERLKREKPGRWTAAAKVEAHSSGE